MEPPEEDDVPLGFVVVELVDEEPSILVVVLDDVPLTSGLIKHAKSEPVSIDKINKSESSFKINCLFIFFSLFLYLIPIFPCGAFRFVIAKGVIGFIFQVVWQILLLYEMIFIIVRIFVSLIQG